MEDDAAASPLSRKSTRVSFGENLIHHIPEDRPLARSNSLPRVETSNLKKGSLEKTWQSSLENTIKGSLQNSWSMGFLWPDHDDHDDLFLQALGDAVDDEDSENDDREPDEREPLMDDVEGNFTKYGTWGSSKDVKIGTPGLLERLGSGEYRDNKVALASSRSCPSYLNLLAKKGPMHRCQTAPAMSSMDREKKATTVKRPQFEKGSSIVTQAGVGLMMYLAVGVLIYTWKSDEFSGIETFPLVDALYFCIVTMCTIGYGDITPVTPFAKLFACAFVLIGFGFIDALVSGMVTYVLDKQEHLLLAAVEGSHYRTAKKYFMNAKHGNRIRIRLKVGIALGVPVLCMFVGTLVMMQTEKLPLIDALYCTIMSITTVGYGDHTFESLWGRLFAAVWLLVSTLAVARCFLYLAEARIDKRHRLIAKWVLQRELTVGDLVQADLDHDGCIRSEL